MEEGLRLLAVHGSGRPRGNTRRLMDEVVAGARSAVPDLDVEEVLAYSVDVAACTVCGDCEDGGGRCCITGDDWAAIEESLRSADALVLAFPVYFVGPPGPLKVIIDRLQALWWLRERGGTVATNRGPIRRAALVMAAANGEEMLGPSRRIAMAALRTLGFELAGEVAATRLEGPEDAEGRPELLLEARRLGGQLVGPAPAQRTRNHQ